MRRLLGIVCGTALIVLVGCQLTQTGASGPVGTGQQQAGRDEESRELREIKQLLEQTGLTVSALAQDIQTQAELQRLEAGPPPIVRDLWATQRVLTSALQAAQLKKSQETLTLLARLETLGRALYSDLPASQIIVHSERALMHLQLADPNLEDAAAELAAAYKIASDPKLPKLRPAGVDAQIQSNAKAHVSAGRPDAAIEVLKAVLAKCRDHWSLQLLDRVNTGIEAARSAVNREAWPVVEAELMEVHRELGELAEQVHLQRYESTQEETTAPTPAAEGTEGAEAGSEATGAGEAAPPAGGAGEVAPPPAEEAPAPAPGEQSAPQPPTVQVTPSEPSAPSAPR